MAKKFNIELADSQATVVVPVTAEDFILKFMKRMTTSSWRLRLG